MFCNDIGMHQWSIWCGIPIIYLQWPSSLRMSDNTYTENNWHFHLDEIQCPLNIPIGCRQVLKCSLIIHSIDKHSMQIINFQPLAE